MSILTHYCQKCNDGPQLWGYCHAKIITVLPEEPDPKLGQSCFLAVITLWPLAPCLKLQEREHNFPYM